MDISAETLKVLFADDDFVIRQKVGKALADEGWEVIEAQDGKEAWEKFQQTSPDVVVLDIDMPEYNGLEVIQFIQSIDLHTPLILYSSLVSEKELKKRVRFNFQFRLIKDYDPSFLVYVIKQMYKPKENHIYHLAKDVTFDSCSLELNNQGKITSLSSTIPGKILQALCNNANRLTPRNLLLEAGWGSTQVNLEAQLNKAISQVKHLLKDAKDVTIQTDKGRGYWLKLREEY
ncbi:MAG: response regulator [Odoribacter sp.]|nr:response regulator [Odoribacter sp.]